MTDPRPRPPEPTPGPPGGLSRRGVLLGAAAAAWAAGCRRKSPEEKATVTTRGRWGGLDGTLVSALPEDQKGGRALVLLHGFRMRPGGETLLRGARQVAARLRMRVLLPEGPEAAGKGRAWWGGDGRYWPRHAGGDEQGDDLATDPPLAAARSAVQAVLRDVRARYLPQALLLAGYSQGAMLALDVALARAPAVDRVVALSGTMLAASLPGLRAAGAARTPVFMAHGQRDQVVPFAAGTLARSLLEKQGHLVTFRPFDGGHQLPPRAIFDELLAFLGAPT